MVSNTNARTDGTDRDGTVTIHDPQLRRACDSVRASLAALGHPSALDFTNQQLVDGVLMVRRNSGARVSPSPNFPRGDSWCL